MSMRDRIRDSADQRFFAMETLRASIDWIKTTSPMEIYATTKVGKDDRVVGDEELKNKMRDWVNKSGDLIEKAWNLPTLMVEDAIQVMRKMTVATEIAIQKGTPESK